MSAWSIWGAAIRGSTTTSLTAESKTIQAEIFVSLDARKGDESVQLLESLRGKFAAHADAQITLEQFQNGPPIEALITARILGPELSRLAAEVERTLKRAPGTRDVDNPLRLERIDYGLGIDTEKAALLGIRSLDIDRTTRLSVAGLDAAQFRDKRGDEYPIRLRLPIDGFPTSALLDQLYFTSRSSGEAVALAQVATPHFGGLLRSTLLARIVTPVRYKLLPPVLEQEIGQGRLSKATSFTAIAC